MFLIEEIEKREKEKRQKEEGSLVKLDILNLLEHVIKSKNSLLVMKSGNLINEEQYNKLYQSLKKEYEDKKEQILSKVKDLDLDIDLTEDLTDYEKITNIENFYKKIQNEPFMKKAKTNTSKNEKIKTIAKNKTVKEEKNINENTVKNESEKLVEKQEINTQKDDKKSSEDDENK